MVLRHFGPALDRLMERGTEVVIAYEATNSLAGGFFDWCARRPLARPVTLCALPAEKEERRRRRMLRLGQDYLRYFSPAFRKVEMLRKRAQHLAPPAIMEAFPPELPMSRRRLAALQRLLARGEAATPPFESDLALLRAIRPDAVVVSPLIDYGSPQVDLLKAAAAEDIPTGLCVASWDNLTNKGLIRFVPNLVTVWNDAQKREARLYHGVPEDHVVTTGAQTFDAWFEKKPSRSRAEWLRLLGLPEDQKLVVYLCSSSQIAGNERAFVLKWLKALRASREPRLANASVLIRPHPRNLAIWEPSQLDGHRNVTVWRYGPDLQGPETQTDFYDTLYYADATVGLNTSSQIDAAIVGAPVFSIIDRATNVGTVGTIHFRHLMAKHGGPTHIAKGIAKNIKQLEACLADPGKYRAINEAFVAHFVRPHGLARPGAELLAQALGELCEGRVNGAAVHGALPARPLLPALSRRRADRLIGYRSSAKPEVAVPLPKKPFATRALLAAAGRLHFDRQLSLALDPQKPVASLILLYNVARMMPFTPPAELWLPREAREELGLAGLGSDAVKIRWLPRQAVRAGQRLGALQLPTAEALKEAQRHTEAEIAEITKEVKTLEAEMQQDLAFVERFKLRALEAGQRELLRQQRGLSARQTAPWDTVSRRSVRRLKKAIQLPSIYRSEAQCEPPVEAGRKVLTILADPARDREIHSYIPYSKTRSIKARELLPLARAFEEKGWQVLVLGGRKQDWPAGGAIRLLGNEDFAAGAALEALSRSRFAVARGLFWTLYARLCGTACLTIDAYDPWLHYPLSARDGALFGRFLDKHGETLSLRRLAERLQREGRPGLEGLRVEKPSGEQIRAAAEVFVETLGKRADDRDTGLRSELWLGYNALTGGNPNLLDHHLILGRGLVLEAEALSGHGSDSSQAPPGEGSDAPDERSAVGA
ncbi:hypothetical protein [Tistlia consotensis]|uniref:hypothetical protein n=1 Tax=Tistlia consotensis TaxID=1321365 RepID=UPI000A14877D|nr:hypothetical protein [Tistlia consotensis]